MASPGSVVIQFLTDTGKAVRDLTGLGKALGKVEGQADDVDSAMRDAQRGIDKTGDTADLASTDLRGMGTQLDAVGTDADQMAADLRAAASDIATGMQTAEVGVDGATSRIRTDMGEAGRETGAEFISNLAEGIGSGQANAQEVIQGTLGGLTNLAATLTGPVGLAAGAAAAGIGLVFSAIAAESQRAADQLNSTLAALQGISDLGSRTAEQAIFDAWIEGAKETGVNLQDVQDVLAIAGVSAEEFQGALAGNPADLQVVQDKLLGQADAINKAGEEQGYLTEEQGNYLKNLPMVTKEINNQRDASWDAKDTQSAINDLTDDEITKTGRWKTEMEGVNTEAGNVKGTIDDIPDNKTVHIKWATDPYPKGVPAPGSSAAGLAVGAQAAATVNVYASGPTLPASPRALVEMLDTYTLRMGRKPGTPRAVAW